MCVCVCVKMVFAVGRIRTVRGRVRLCMCVCVFVCMYNMLVWQIKMEESEDGKECDVVALGTKEELERFCETLGFSVSHVYVHENLRKRFMGACVCGCGCACVCYRS